MKVLKFIFSAVSLWFAGMVYHLARIAVGRPAFDRMSDSAPMAASFLVIYFVAGLLKCFVMGKGLLGSSFYLIVYMLMLAILLERSNRSSALLAAALGASAVTDFSVALNLVVGMSPDDWLMKLTYLAEPVLIFIAWRNFNNLPKDMQARGYRAGSLS